MQFNDTTNKTGIVQDIDFLLYGSSATLNSSYSIADRTRNVNRALDDIVNEIFKADPSWNYDDSTDSDFPIATVDLTSALDHYTIPDSALVIHRVRFKDQNGDWITLTPTTRAELSDSDLKATGTPDEYFKMGNAVFPIPIPDYAYGQGVELEFQRGGNYFVAADTTKTPGLAPVAHRFLSIAAAHDFAVAKGMQKKIVNLASQKEALRIKILEFYQRRNQDDIPHFNLKRGSSKRFGL